MIVLARSQRGNDVQYRLHTTLAREHQHQSDGDTCRPVTEGARVVIDENNTATGIDIASRQIALIQYKVSTLVST